MADELLAAERILACIARGGGTAARHLDVPGGTFADGEGGFVPGGGPAAAKAGGKAR